MLRQLLNKQGYAIGPGDELLDDLPREGFAVGQALHHRLDLLAA